MPKIRHFSACENETAEVNSIAVAPSLRPIATSLLPSVSCNSTTMEGSISLPNINRASSENSIFYAGMSTKAGQGEQTAKSSFEKRIDRMGALDFPVMDGAASVKGRLALLETSVDVQGDHNKQAQQSLLAVSKNLDDVDGNIKSMLLNMQNDFDLKLSTMKKEYDHRYVKVFSQLEHITYPHVMSNINISHLGLTYKPAKTRDCRATSPP